MNHAAVSSYTWATAAAIVVGIVLATVGVVTVAVCWAASRLPARTPPPRPPASPCTWCKPEPRGMCTCAGVCGHIRCIGDHTTLGTLTAQDMRLLRKWIREGHE